MSDIFLPIQQSRQLFIRRGLFRRTLNLRGSTKYTWIVRWLKSHAVSAAGFVGFVLLLAYALAEWCTQ